MSGVSFEPAILKDNLRCKIIYYSCVTPNTISDLNQAWGYSSPTYLYQNSSLEELKDAGLINVETEGGKNTIRSNYDILFSEENIDRSRDSVNKEILREFLVQSKGFHPRVHHRGEEDDLLSIGRGNLDEDLEERLQNVEFDYEEYEKMVELWRNEVFRDVFFSLENLSILFADSKDELPDNPLNYLFKITAGLAASIGRGRRERNLHVPSGLCYRAEKIIVPSYRRLKNRYDLDDEDYAQFIVSMKNVYSLFRGKFHEDVFDYTFIEDFIDITLQEEEEKKFSNIFRKYRDRSGGGFF